MMKSTVNIGIFAHVDTGKTTLSEQLLSVSGAIRKKGSVDRGTAHTDRLEVERRRGISVQSACAPLVWREVRINLIDTPGHVDFAAEIERGMWALDAAVLVVAGYASRPNCDKPEIAECMVHDRAHGFGHKALAPQGLAQPVGQLALIVADGKVRA